MEHAEKALRNAITSNPKQALNFTLNPKPLYPKPQILNSNETLNPVPQIVPDGSLTCISAKTGLPYGALPLAGVKRSTSPQKNRVKPNSGPQTLNPETRSPETLKPLNPKTLKPSNPKP